MKIRLMSASDPDAGLLQSMLPGQSLAAELRDPTTYVWAVGCQDDHLVGAHRAIIAHGCIFLRGVFSFANAGYPVAIPLAKYLLRHAAESGIERSHLWVESFGRETKIAKVLGASVAEAPLHRYRVPVNPVSHDNGNTGRMPVCGTDSNLVWLRDRDAAVIFNLSKPDGHPGPLGLEVVRAAFPVPTPLIEVALPAADLFASFELLKRGAVRSSRRPVHHASLLVRS